MSKTETAITGALAVILLGLFIGVAIFTMTKMDNPPLVGDVAPSTSPALLCPKPAPSSSTPTRGQTGTPSSGAQASLSPTTSIPSTPASTGSVPVVVCSPDQLKYAPQYRASFDESARLIGLLAIIAPLVTTVVAFYFGQKAGVGAGQAAGQADAAAAKATATEIVRNQVAPGSDRDDMIKRIEEAKRP